MENNQSKEERKQVIKDHIMMGLKSIGFTLLILLLALGLAFIGNFIDNLEEKEEEAPPRKRILVPPTEPKPPNIAIEINKKIIRYGGKR